MPTRILVLAAFALLTSCSRPNMSCSIEGPKSKSGGIVVSSGETWKGELDGFKVDAIYSDRFFINIYELKNDKTGATAFAPLPGFLGSGKIELVVRNEKNRTISVSCAK